MRFDCVRTYSLLALLLLVSALLMVPHPVLAGAWTQPRGEGQAITTVSAYRSSGGFDDRGLAVAGAHYRRIEIASYVEYGLLDGLTIGLEPRAQWASSDAGTYSAASHGLGDIDVFVRKRLVEGAHWVGSVQGLAVIPYAYDRRADLPAGSGRAAFEMRILAGRNVRLKTWPGYIDLESAYRIGTAGIPDELRGDFSLGLRPRPGWLVLGELSANESLSASSVHNSAGYGVIKFQASIVRRLTQHLAIQLGASRDLAGRRVGLGGSVLGALWWRF